VYGSGFLRGDIRRRKHGVTRQDPELDIVNYKTFVPHKLIAHFIRRSNRIILFSF
jgi:hypothetical protein